MRVYKVSKDNLRIRGSRISPTRSMNSTFDWSCYPLMAIPETNIKRNEERSNTFSQLALRK